VLRTAIIAKEHGHCRVEGNRGFVDALCQVCLGATADRLGNFEVMGLEVVQSIDA
jgi:hypothetical protein